MSIGTSASVLALGCLAAFLAPAGSYAADADTSNEEQYQESVWHLRVRQFWRWQVHEHRELDTGRLLLDAGQLTDPGRPRSFRPGSCDPSSGPCPQVVPVPPVGMEQAHSVRPPDTETYDGRDDTSGRVILLAVLVAIGFLVLICVVIGLYCTWLHLHYSGCDTEVCLRNLSLHFLTVCLHVWEWLSSFLSTLSCSRAGHDSTPYVLHSYA